MKQRPPLNKLGHRIRVAYVLGRDEFVAYTKSGETPNASTMYRVIIPITLANYSEMAEVHVMDQFVLDEKTGKLLDAQNPVLQWADAVVFARQNAIPRKETGLIVAGLKEAGVLVGFESDDNYWEIPESTYVRAAADPELIEQTRIVAREADFYIAPNYLLNEANKKHSGGDPLVMAAIPNAPMFAEWEEAAKGRKAHKDIRILLAGTKNHFVDWLSVFPQIEKVMEEAKDQDVVCTLHVAGISIADLMLAEESDKYLPRYKEDAEKVLDWINRLKAKSYEGVDLQEYPKLLNRISPDIAVIVTQDTSFDRCKSSLKYVDYTMAGAAVLCPEFQPYTDELSDKEVVFYGDPEAFEINLCKLVMDKGMRHSLTTHGRKFVKENYSAHAIYPMFVEAWEDAYKKKWGINDAPLEVAL